MLDARTGFRSRGRSLRVSRNPICANTQDDPRCLPIVQETVGHEITFQFEDDFEGESGLKHSWVYNMKMVDK